MTEVDDGHMWSHGGVPDALSRGGDNLQFPVVVFGAPRWAGVTEQVSQLY